jgi:hypothetical protein
MSDKIRNVETGRDKRWAYGETWEGDRLLTKWMRPLADPPPPSEAMILQAEIRRLHSYIYYLRKQLNARA